MFNSSTRFSPGPVPVAIGVIAAAALAVFGGAVGANAAEPGDDDFLGTAESFVIVATVTVTDAGLASDVYGDVALTSVTPGAMQLAEDQDVANGQVINGAIYVASPTPDPVAMQAVADVGIAYTALSAASPDEVVGTTNLALIVGHAIGAEVVYEPGVYNSGSVILLDGQIVLDGLNDLDSVFIFQAGSGLTVASGATVLLRNGAQACNVYWKVGSDATIETGARFSGTVVAASSIWVRTGAVIDGQLLAGALGAGEVTLDHNVIDGQSLCIRSSTTEGVTTTTTRVDGITSPGNTPPATPIVRPAVVVPVPVADGTPPSTSAPVVVTAGDAPGALARTGDDGTPSILALGGALLAASIGTALLAASARRSRRS